MHPDDRRPPPTRHSHATRRTLATLTASALLAIPTIAFATSAQADSTCTPADAWTETVPAVGTPTIVTDNPDYVPAAPAVYRTVTHPAVYETVTHPAVYETVTHPAVTETRTLPVQRHTWHPGGQVPEGQTPLTEGSTPLTRPGEWTGNTTNYNGTDPLGEAFFVGGGGANGSWFFWTTTTVEVVVTPARDEQVLVTAEWDEQVLVTAAWDEEVLVTPAVLAQGDPMIEVANPSYVPGSQTEHPAVVCPSSTPGLASTGSDTWTGAVVAAVLVLLGSVLAVVSHRRIANQH